MIFFTLVNEKVKGTINNIRGRIIRAPITLPPIFVPGEETGVNSKASSLSVLSRRFLMSSNPNPPGRSSITGAGIWNV